MSARLCTILVAAWLASAVPHQVKDERRDLKMDVKHATDAGRAGTILFVDDEPLSLKYFKASVGKYANVVTANTPEAALKILEAEGDAISVVVSDERMPRDSGVSFLSNVRKSWPSTVRILTSAYANIDLQQAINGAASRLEPNRYSSSTSHEPGSFGYSTKSARTIGRPRSEQSFACA